MTRRRAPVVASPVAALAAGIGAVALACAPAAAQDGPGARDGGGDAVPGAPAGTIVSRDVAVGAGETLRDIARRELGRAGYAPQLAEHNQSTEGAPLIEGRLVRVPVHVPARGEVALVVFVKGEVTLDGAPLDADAEVSAGAVLATGRDGFLSLEFSSGSVVNLQPDTLVVLERLSCLAGDDSCLIELAAERGGVSGDIDARDGQPARFRISTPHASAAVRGTTFDVVADDAALAVGVTEGAVQVAALGAEVALERGFGSVTRRGEPPGAPRPLLPAPVFRNVPTRVTPGDAVRWWDLTEVDRWAATLSLDGAGVETVAELDLEPGDTIDLAAAVTLEPGDYTLNLRGVDDAGIKGYRAQARVTLAALDAAIAPPDVTVTARGSEFVVAVTDPDPDAPGYEIQISANPDFDDPLGVDVGPPGSAVFRLDADTVHARARVLAEPTRVSGFGPAASSDP